MLWCFLGINCALCPTETLLLGPTKGPLAWMSLDRALTIILIEKFTISAHYRSLKTKKPQTAELPRAPNPGAHQGFAPGHCGFAFFGTYHNENWPHSSLQAPKKPLSFRGFAPWTPNRISALDVPSLRLACHCLWFPWSLSFAFLALITIRKLSTILVHCRPLKRLKYHSFQGLRPLDPTEALPLNPIQGALCFAFQALIHRHRKRGTLAPPHFERRGPPFRPPLINAATLIVFNINITLLQKQNWPVSADHRPLKCIKPQSFQGFAPWTPVLFTSMHKPRGRGFYAFSALISITIGVGKGGRGLKPCFAPPQKKLLFTRPSCNCFQYR